MFLKSSKCSYFFWQMDVVVDPVISNVCLDSCLLTSFPIATEKIWLFESRHRGEVAMCWSGTIRCAYGRRLLPPRMMETASPSMGSWWKDKFGSRNLRKVGSWPSTGRQADFGGKLGSKTNARYGFET